MPSLLICFFSPTNYSRQPGKKVDLNRPGNQTDNTLQKNRPFRMDFDIQPVLENDRVILTPLAEKDFEDVYSAASDPKTWDQHPNKDRWRKEVFKNFFDGAMQSKGGYKIVDKATGETIGSTRYYDYDPSDNSILIGYTFFARPYWGRGMNRAVKTLMLDYIFQFVSRVDFHVGAENLRSQSSIGGLGIAKVNEKVVTYFGEKPKLNFVYSVTKDEWTKIRPIDA